MSDNIDKIRNRTLSIFADIFLDKSSQEKLQQIMNKVSKDGDTRFLSTRDRFFSYCVERNVWYGSKEKTFPPYISIEILLA